MAKLLVVDQSGKIHKEIPVYLSVTNRDMNLEPSKIAEIEKAVWDACMADYVDSACAIKSVVRGL